jgi:ATP-binding cassette subfamily F protein uup
LARDAAAPKALKPRKLSFKEQRELEGMEAQIQAADAEIVRIESLFAQPDFHRTHGPETDQLMKALAAAREKLPRLYARWEQLDKIRLAPPDAM